ncbi:MAG: hypothetical protein AB1505_10785 [Candidatus Latescibacterota bacterium]
MSSVKEAIEEMIEESYLLGLSEEEIRRDFTRFIDTCYTVIQANVRDRAAISGLARDLSRERTCTLIADRTPEPGPVAKGVEVRQEGPSRPPQEVFAEKVARRKRLILRTIGDYDPRLVRLIDEQRFQVDFREVERPRFRARKRRNWERYRLLLLKVGYATTVLLIVLLIYLGLIQRI